MSPPKATDTPLGKEGLRINKAQPVGEHARVPGSDNNASLALRAESYIVASVPEAGVIAIKGHRASISQLAEVLQRSTGVPVWDRTGLPGDYDFAFRFAQGLSADIETDSPSLTTALKENLGLTIKKQKGPVETLIVDYIEEPSAN